MIMTTYKNTDIDSHWHFDFWDQPENGRRQVRQSDHAADCSNKLPTFIAQVLEKSQGLSLSLV